MLAVRRARSSPALRGRWCNFCGARLAGGLLSGVLPAGQRRVEWLESSGKLAAWSLCQDCYEERLRCSSCGRHVGSRAVMIEGESAIYCRACFNNRPRCDTCGRPVGSQYWARHDGRTMCDCCQATSISDLSQAHVLFRRVRSALLRSPGLSLREPCQLKMAGRRQLLSLIQKSSLYTLDADSRTRCFGLFIKEGKHRAIFVEYGLPQILLFEVLAHEYAHAWQSEHGLTCRPPEQQEGFAEWVAFKLLQGWGCRVRVDRLLRRSDVYGRGLRLMLQWEAEGGTGEVLRRMLAQAVTAELAPA